MENNDTANLVVVYEAQQESVDRVLEVLRKEGFNPVALENPDCDGLFVPNNPRYIRGVRHLAHIAVPRDQARSAGSVLRRWDQAREAEVEKLTKNLWGRVFFSFLLAAAITGVFFLLGVCSENIVFVLLGVWLGVVLLVSYAGKGPG